jgi:hypothetical protein
MRQASKRIPDSAEKTVRDIRRNTRRHHSAEVKIRIEMLRVYCRDPELFNGNAAAGRCCSREECLYRQLSKGTHDDIRFGQGAETR